MTDRLAYVAANGSLLIHLAPVSGSRWVTTACGVSLFASAILSSTPRTLQVCRVCTQEATPVTGASYQ